jgi:hypothetical protein
MLTELRTAFPEARNSKSFNFSQALDQCLAIGSTPKGAARSKQKLAFQRGRR